MSDLLAFLGNESSLALLVLASPTIALATLGFLYYRSSGPVREVNGAHKHLLTREQFNETMQAYPTRAEFNNVVSGQRAEQRATAHAIGVMAERVASLEATVKALHELLQMLRTSRGGPTP